ncbi:GNAT family N-acetyltransferase [Halolamina salina]|uniref:GNAT family N-acetyltransferase n=1 Tax=Halolamina salina TaxID=1220023 RepID=A0ABD6B5K7_9EURY
MPHATFIDGDRIELRPPDEGDIPLLVEAENHPQVRRHVTRFRTPVSEAAYREDRWPLPNDDDGVELLVVPKSGDFGGEPVGSVSLAPIQQPDGYANFGVWLHPDAWGNGYALDAGAHLLDYGFRAHRLHRVSATVAGSNDASRRLCERLGFAEEDAAREAWFLDGEHVDAVHYGLLEREWDGPAAALE